ncbi:Helicase associated domain protein [Streptomyces rhizosphaerihabitans]|uniref:Helicase associated domain protein n=1 Tax=Streptomyces rhizosphaerihabitans TaxID=1266770 RepID=UPI0021C119E3|nr:Helicase associated domain protein [Streptomyces rhizosphaerihabitans]MCT9010509.1 transposase [Streptomyces rhizosphaerihabitans]
MVFACRLCTARRGAADRPVWVYRQPWQRWCGRQGRWLFAVGDGHPLEFADVSTLGAELAQANRRWGRVKTAAAGAAPGEVFALARAVVCRWWELEDFWARETVWGPRLAGVAESTQRRCGNVPGWGEAQWRLLVRDCVVFPEVVAVAAALVDTRLVERVGRQMKGLLRDRAGVEPFAAVLGERLQRPWLAGVERAGAPGPLARWVAMTAREQRKPDGVLPLRGFKGKWSVRAPHRPVEVGVGLLELASESSSADDGGLGEAAAEERSNGQSVAGQSSGGPGWALWQREAELFADGVERARRHLERFGHLAVAHTGSGVVDGFDLGRWLAGRRAEAVCLTAEQTAQLEGLDPWWNPPWPVGWQRFWHRVRRHVEEHGPVHGGDNLDGLPRGLQTWLRRQILLYETLHPGQQGLLAELGLTAGEVERFRAWPARRRHPGEAFAAAQVYAARFGHLAVTGATVIDGIALDAWLSSARRRQRTTGRPTRLGTRLHALDPWWNPPWALSWQRMWWAAHHHLNGLPDGTQWWPDAPGKEGAVAWLRQQHTRTSLLLPGQRQLVADLMRVAGDGPVWRPRISDQAWHTLADLLPSRPAGDRRYRNQREILEAIIHIACTGQTWPHTPAELGSFATCRITDPVQRLGGVVEFEVGQMAPQLLEAACFTHLHRRCTHSLFSSFGEGTLRSRSATAA